MNDFIHPLKQLCKLVYSPARDCTCISLSPTLFGTPNHTHVEKTDKGGKVLPLPSPLPTFPWEDQTLQLSPPWHISSAEDNEQSQHRVTTSRVIFIPACLPPKKERSYHLEFGSRDLKIYEPSWVTWSISAARTWPGGGTGTGEAESCVLTETTMAHPRLRWRIFLYRSLAHLYPRPSTSEIPVEWLTPGYTCASKILGRDCAHSGSSSNDLTQAPGP